MNDEVRAFPAAGVLVLWWVLLVGAAAALLAVGAHGGGGSPSLGQRTAQIAAQVRCPVCDGLSVQDSTAPIAVAIKSDIRSQLVSGRTPAEIESGLVARYGQSVLLAPSRSGIGLAVWLVPVAAVGAGVSGLAIVLRRRGRRIVSPHDDEIDEIDELDRIAVEAELARRESE